MLSVIDGINGKYIKQIKYPHMICTPKVSDFWGAYHCRTVFIYKRKIPLRRHVFY